MKWNNLIVIALLFLCSSCEQRTDGFVLKGNIPGLEDGMTVKLRNIEKEKAVLVASDTVRKGGFELRGNVDMPTLCELIVTNRSSVTDKNKMRTRKTWVFLDNSQLTLTAPHFDSIGYVVSGMPSSDERNCVSGSPLQEEFNTYRRTLLPQELHAWQFERELSKIRFESYEYEPDEYARHYARLWPQILKGRADIRAARLDFIRNHPHSPISLYAAETIIRESGDFLLTIEELETVSASVSMVTGDTARTARFNRQLKRARHLARGTHFNNIILENLDGDTVSLSAFVPTGCYTLIDFWASWCGPCRAALPQIKELFKQYDGRLAIISLSCDDKTEDWKKAVREEQLTAWPQVRAGSNESRKKVYVHYNVTAIPQLILISPEGRVVYATNDPQELSLILQDILQISGN